MEFQLFRLQVIDLVPPSEPEMFLKYRKNNVLDRPNLLRELFAKGLKEDHETKKWRAGNVKYHQQESIISFRFGKLKVSERSKFKDGNFIEESETDAPSTQVFFDLQTQVIAFARKTSIAPTIRSIANSFERFLNSFSEIAQNKIHIEIEQVNNPDDFLAQISNSYAVSKFWLKVKHPNAIDVNQDIMLPLEKTVASTQADSAKAELSGTALVVSTLEDIARSCASKGNDAGATIKENQDQGSKRIRLGHNPVTVQVNEEEEGFLQKAFALARTAYNKIRNGKHED